MKNAKLLTDNGEIAIPVSDAIYKALCENSTGLGECSSEVRYLIKEIFPPRMIETSMIVGDACFKVDIEEYYFSYISQIDTTKHDYANFHLEEFDSILRRTVPSNKRPPSVRQSDYMVTIAARLQIDIPAKALVNADACSQFIECHVDEFKVLSAEDRAFINASNRIARRCYADFLHRKGASLAEVASKLDVVRESTAEKYLEEFNCWASDLKKLDHPKKLVSIDMVNSILENEYPEVVDFLDYIESFI